MADLEEETLRSSTREGSSSWSSTKEDLKFPCLLQERTIRFLPKKTSNSWYSIKKDLKGSMEEEGLKVLVFCRIGPVEEENLKILFFYKRRGRSQGLSLLYGLSLLQKRKTSGSWFSIEEENLRVLVFYRIARPHGLGLLQKRKTSRFWTTIEKEDLKIFSIRSRPQVLLQKQRAVEVFCGRRRLHCLLQKEQILRSSIGDENLKVFHRG